MTSKRAAASPAQLKPGTLFGRETGVRTFELGDVIAERELLFAPNEGEPHAVTVRIGRPVPDFLAPRESWCCPYQIVGIDGDRVFAIFGVDAMQALVLALHTVPAELAAFVRARGGKFLHLGAPDETWLRSCRSALEYAGDALPGGASQADYGSHQVDVRQPGPFLRRVMRELAGGARVSFEGTFGDTVFTEELIVSREPLGVLRRNTVTPVLSFVVLKLEDESADSIFSTVSQIGLREDIVHVQVEKGGRLELKACDNFHSDGVVTGPGVEPAILAELQTSGVVRSFAPSPQDGPKY